jgi:hypothetical protein
VYDRFDDETRAYVDRMIAEMREVAKEHAPEVSKERRERLLKEKATLMVHQMRVDMDAWAAPDGTGPGRGLVIETDVEIDGETYTVTKANPALRASSSMSARQREIAEELRLWPGYQDEEDTGRTVAEILSE